MAVLKVKVNGEWQEIPAIVGPAGPQGIPGAQGDPGEQGIQGEAGKGIFSFEKTGTSGLIDTYRMTYTDGSWIDMQVSNGKGIRTIAKTGTSGNVDTYTITFNDNTTMTFTVTNANIDDTAGAGVTNKTWSANKLSQQSAEVTELKSALNDVTIKMINDYPQNSGSFKSDGTWVNATSANYKHIVVPIQPSDEIEVTAGATQASFAVFSSYTTPVNGATIPFSSQTGFTTYFNVSAGETLSIQAPSDAAYLYIGMLSVGSSIAPSNVVINGIDITKAINTNIANISKVAAHAYAEATESTSEVTQLKERTSYNMFADYQIGWGTYNSSGNWTNISANYTHSVINVSPGDSISITAEAATWCGILTSYNTPVANNPIPFSSVAGFTGPISISASSTVAFIAPSDAVYLIVLTKSTGNDNTPSVISINNINIKKTPIENFVEEIAKTAELESQETETGKKLQQLDDSIHFYAIPAMEQHSGMIKAAGIWGYVDDTNHVYKHVIIPVSSGDVVYCAGCKTALAFLRSYSTPVNAQAVDFSTEEGYTNVKTLAIENDNTYVVPSDTHYIYVKTISDGTADDFSGTLSVNGVSIVKPLVYTIQKILFPEKTVNWCAMGDSITYGYYSVFDDGGGASSHTSGRENIGWAFLVAKENNWNLTNIAIGGEGYLDIASGQTGYCGYTQARATDFSGYDLVTIALGVNDWKANTVMGSMDDDPTAETITAFIPAMRATLEAIMTSNPSCKIIVITPLNNNGYGHDYGTQATNWGMGYAMSNSGTLKQFRDKMIEICELYGVQYIDMSSASCINSIALPTMLPDGVHPAIETHKLLARELAKKITF